MDEDVHSIFAYLRGSGNWIDLESGEAKAVAAEVLERRLRDLESGETEAVVAEALERRFFVLEATANEVAKPRAVDLGVWSQYGIRRHKGSTEGLTG